MKITTQPQVIGIIPARYASTRFPGKPLIDIAGKSMIRRVYEQASKAKSLHKVVVATDDDRIFEHVNKFGGSAIMTSNTHQSGTDRCAEVIGQLTGYDLAINIQGDEPYIDPKQIDLLVGCFEGEAQIATLIKVIDSEEVLFNTNIPKVVISNTGKALLFSRQTIPALRNAVQDQWLTNHTYYKHIGIYGYRTAILQALTQLPVSSLEKAESLEQLRWLENGYNIYTAITDIETIAIDTPEDLEKLIHRY